MSFFRRPKITLDLYDSLQGDKKIASIPVDESVTTYIDQPVRIDLEGEVHLFHLKHLYVKVHKQ